MKKGLLSLLIAVMAGLTAFGLMRRHQTGGRGDDVAVGLPPGPKGSASLAPALDAMPELEWLRSELHLTDPQFTRVAELHQTYRPKCAEMCRRIAEAEGKLESLTEGTGALTPEASAALRERALVQADCQEAMLNHLYQTASVLEPDQARQYLKTMIPYALEFSHEASSTSSPHAP